MRDLKQIARDIIQYLREGGTLSERAINKFDSRAKKLLLETNKMILAGETQATVERFIRKEANDTVGALEATIVAGAVLVAKKESAKIRRDIAGLTGSKLKDIKKLTISDDYMRKVLRRPMHSANYSVADGMQAIGVNLSRSTIATVRRAYEAGTDIKDISALFMDNLPNADLQRIARNLDSVARTSISAVANSVRLDTYKKSEEIDRVLYVAVLDSKTSAFCASHDGRVYKLDEPKPTLPAHFNCRSTYVPILVDDNAREVKQNLNRRALDYSTWLKSQSKEEQINILGEKAYKQFNRTGNLSKALGVAVV